MKHTLKIHSKFEKILLKIVWYSKLTRVTGGWVAWAAEIWTRIAVAGAVAIDDDAAVLVSVEPLEDWKNCSKKFRMFLNIFPTVLVSSLDREINPSSAIDAPMTWILKWFTYEYIKIVNSRNKLKCCQILKCKLWRKFGNIINEL